jgi:hypothetical protein
MFLTTKRIPEEATHWSIELIARYAQVTPWQVRQIWKAADSRPPRLKTFKTSTDPAFAEKVVDIVGPYMNPPHVPSSPEPVRKGVSRCCRDVPAVAFPDPSRHVPD